MLTTVQTRQLQLLVEKQPHAFRRYNVDVEFKVTLTYKSVTGAAYSIKSYSLSHSWTLW